MSDIQRNEIAVVYIYKQFTYHVANLLMVKQCFGKRLSWTYGRVMWS